MSNGTLETIKKYITDNLGASLTPVSDDLDVEAFRMQIGSNVAKLRISRPLVDSLEATGQVEEYLADLDISSFVRRHPNRNLLLSDKGIVIDPTNT